MTTEEKIEVMQAFLDGKEIQHADKRSGVWMSARNPSWNWADNEYRIKPSFTNYQLEVMEAYKAGKAIECKEKTLSKWVDVGNPYWNWKDIDYRVKPEPRLLTIADLPLGVKIITLVFPGGFKSIVYGWNHVSLNYWYSNHCFDTIEKLNKDGAKWSIDGGKTLLSFEKQF